MIETEDLQQHGIIILDFGSQYTQLIARRVRECGVFSEVLPGDADINAIKAHHPRGIIFSGGPASIAHTESLRVDSAVYQLGIPILGICYGMQMMAAQLGGVIAAAEVQEFGYSVLNLQDDFPLVDKKELEKQAGIAVWMSHGDHVQQLPPGFSVVANTSDCAVAAMMDAKRKFYGLQFHPEVTHTEYGVEMLSHFVMTLCGCDANWTQAAICEAHVEMIRQQVGDQKVLLALSGGVDSSVTAALLHRAIGEQLQCVFVDTGLLRHQEADQVMQTFVDDMGIDVIKVDAQERFFACLKGVDDPELKRKRIGNCFIEVFSQAAEEQFQQIPFLAQGTIYSDVIESAKSKHGKSQVIKSHHNVGGLPEDMPFKLVEPLRDLFKDEVRQLGLTLGLSEKVVYRHPFPGPGLALRIIGSVDPDSVALLQRADHIFIDLLRSSGLYTEVSQAFAVLLPVRSVGVKGDQRAYGQVLVIRSVNSSDFMTAEWSPLPHEFLARVSERICNSIAEITRVVYDISSKPPSTIEWE